jgi:hypothetical protein
MEEVTLEELAKNYEFQKPKYFASYNQDGNIISIFGSENGSLIDNNVIEVESNLAISIITGEKNIFSYKVDCSSLKIYKFTQNELIANYSLHRVGQDIWSKITNPDIKILCKKSENSLIFILSPTFKNIKDYESYKLTFYITDYNDPDSLRNIINFDFLDLTKNEILFKNINLHDKFSIFTKPLFKCTTTIL